MPTIENIKIQYTGQSMTVLVRELNRRLDTIRATIDQNFFDGYPQVDAMVTTNADTTIWISTATYEIERWVVYVDNVTTSPTINLRLNGTNQDTQTQTVVQVYEYELATPVSVARLDRVSLNVTNLTAGAVVTAGIGLRRLT